MEKHESVLDIFGIMMLSMMFGVDVSMNNQAESTLVEVLNEEKSAAELAGLLNVDKETIENSVGALKETIKKTAEEAGMSEREVIEQMMHKS